MKALIKKIKKAIDGMMGVLVGLWIVALIMLIAGTLILKGFVKSLRRKNDQ